MMVVKFGFNRVCMESGIAKDKSCGVCRITKHFNEFSTIDVDLYDSPIQLQFYNISSVDVLIESLRAVKKEMINSGKF